MIYKKFKHFKKKNVRRSKDKIKYLKKDKITRIEIKGCK
jgi:hypothetical protein